MHSLIYFMPDSSLSNDVRLQIWTFWLNMHDSIIFSSGFLAPYRNALTLSSLWKLIANFISSKILVDEVIHYQASRHLNLIILSIKHKFTATTWRIQLKAWHVDILIFLLGIWACVLNICKRATAIRYVIDVVHVQCHWLEDGLYRIFILLFI